MTTIAKLAIAGALAALPLAATAQSSDAAYCETLSQLYRKTAAKHSTPAAAVPVAMAQCQAGNTANGIPVLEQALRNVGMTLPRRG